MLARLNQLRPFVALLGLATATSLLCACDGAVAPPVSDQNAQPEPANYLAYECSTRSQNAQLGEIQLTPRQMLNTLEYALNPAFKYGVAEQGVIQDQPIFDGQIIANIAPPRALAAPLALQDIAAEFMAFRRSAEGLCDLSLNACASDFIAHFYTAFNTRSLNDAQLQALLTQFSEAPEETLAQIAADNILNIDLTGLTKSEIAAIRLSLLLQYRLPGHDYQQWMEHYSLGSSAGRAKLADLLLNHSQGFKSSVADFFGDYLFYSAISSDREYSFPEEVLDTLYSQVLGASSPVFEGTFADIFNSNMALVAPQHESAYVNEGAMSFGPYTKLSARKDQAYFLFQTEGRPGVFSQLAMLNHSPLNGYHYYHAFTCSAGLGGDHPALYGDDYAELLTKLNDEEVAQGFAYPRLERLIRAIEIGDETLEGPSCSWCHMPTLSVDRALSVFHENGEKRSVFDDGNELTLPFNTSGQFYRVSGGIKNDELIAFDNLTDFFSQVVKTDMAKQCFVSSWIERALQVPDEFNCQSESLQRDFDASSGHIRTLLLDIIGSDLFTSNGQSF